jgi:hypothetical protein
VGLRTQPSNAHSPEYSANAYEDGLLLELSNHGPVNDEEARPLASWTIPRTVTETWYDVGIHDRQMRRAWTYQRRHLGYDEQDEKQESRAYIPWQQ